MQDKKGLPYPTPNKGRTNKLFARGCWKKPRRVQANLELKEKQLSDTKKILVSANQSYDRTVAENKELKAYIESLKQRFQGLQQQQQAQFLQQQKN